MSARVSCSAEVKVALQSAQDDGCSILPWTCSAPQGTQISRRGEAPYSEKWQVIVQYMVIVV